MDQQTIRELGAEIAWEIDAAVERAESNGDQTFDRFDWVARIRAVDLVMAVLARHSGSTILNDVDIPVEPLPLDKRSLSTE